MPHVLAVVAHPDDIEFVMAGTLLRLADRGWQVHYFNVANGCLGSMTTGPEETARIRLEEAKQAAALIPATHYPPICDDMDIHYNAANLRKVVSVVRRANPTIVLTHSPIDYMEDHEAACRLAVSAAFSKGIPSFVSDPPVPYVECEVAIYHASPHGNCTPLGEPIQPHLFVDTSEILERKTRLLECHRSQQAWLGTTQKMSSYLQTMIDLDRQRGELSGRFAYAEGFRRHLHLGFSSPGFDPLVEALGPHIHIA